MKDAVKTTTNNNNRNETTMISTKTPAAEVNAAVAALLSEVGSATTNPGSPSAATSSLYANLKAQTTKAGKVKGYKALLAHLAKTKASLNAPIGEPVEDAIQEASANPEFVEFVEALCTDALIGEEPTAEEIAQDEAELETPNPVGAPKTDGLAALNALFAAGSNDLGDTAQAEKTSTWEAKQAEAVAAYTSGKTQGSTEGKAKRGAVKLFTDGVSFPVKATSVETKTGTGGEVFLIDADGTTRASGPGQDPTIHTTILAAVKAAGLAFTTKSGKERVDQWRLLTIQWNGKTEQLMVLRDDKYGQQARDRAAGLSKRAPRAAKILTAEQAQAKLDKANEALTRATQRSVDALAALTEAKAREAAPVAIDALAVSEGA